MNSIEIFMSDKKSLACKVVLLGEGGVGKTSLRRTYLGEGFKKNYAMTIGADFAAKRLMLDGWNITSNIWDLAGQSKFKAMRETYYKGASGALLVFDISRRETLNALDNWIEELRVNNQGELVPIIVIGNKADLRNLVTDTVSIDDALKYAQELSNKFQTQIHYVESSAKTGENVNKAFELLIKQIYQLFKEELNLKT